MPASISFLVSVKSSYLLTMLYVMAYRPHKVILNVKYSGSEITE